MVNIAVAGGTGSLGRTVVEVLHSQGKHRVKVLSRKADAKMEGELGVSIIVVDYTSVDHLSKILEGNQIDTVIATLQYSTSAEPEINLIKAADISNSTRRYIASSWGVPYSEKEAATFPIAGLKLQAWTELKKTGLEYTRFNNGFFTDYWGVPHFKTYLQPTTLVVDMANNTAAIPGSGNTPVVFTTTSDVAKFVAASLDLDKWEEESYVIGDKVTWNEFVKLAEAAKGTKFNISNDSIDFLKTGQITELPAHKLKYQFFPKEQLQWFLSIFEIWFDEGLLDFKPKHTLNEEFPQIRPMTVKALLDEAWKGQ